MSPTQKRILKVRQSYAEFIKWYPFTTEDLDGEEWRDISGYEGLYQVSNFGRVKSFKRNKPRILKPALYHGEYPAVPLTLSHREDKPFNVHRLVAQAFIPNPDGKPQVNHLDGCKLNACASNLEWATPSENSSHAHRLGLACNAKGGDDSQAKLTNEQARYVRDNPENLTIGKLAEKFRVNRQVIANIQHGQTYKEAGGKIKRQWKRVKHTPRVPDEIRAQICAEYKGGDKEHGAIALAKKYGIDRHSVARIANEGYETEIEKNQHSRFVSNEVRAQILETYIPRDKRYGAVALAKKYGISCDIIGKIVNADRRAKNEDIPYTPRVPDEIRAQICAEYIKGSEEFGSNALAKKYGVDPKTILNIVTEARRARGEVIPKGKSHPRVSDEIRTQIRAIFIKGDKKFGATALAKKYGITRQTVMIIVNEK